MPVAEGLSRFFMAFHEGQTAGDEFCFGCGNFEVTFSLAAPSSNSCCSESVGRFSARGISPRIQAGRGLDCLSSG